VVALVVLVEPSVTVLAAAPVAKLTVVAAASILMPKVPVPELKELLPLEAAIEIPPIVTGKH